MVADPEPVVHLGLVSHRQCPVLTVYASSPDLPFRRIALLFEPERCVIRVLAEFLIGTISLFLDSLREFIVIRSDVAVG